jgi:hypothetical protein
MAVLSRQAVVSLKNVTTQVFRVAGSWLRAHVPNRQIDVASVIENRKIGRFQDRDYVHNREDAGLLDITLSTSMKSSNRRPMLGCLSREQLGGWAISVASISPETSISAKLLPCIGVTLTPSESFSLTFSSRPAWFTPACNRSTRCRLGPSPPDGLRIRGSRPPQSGPTRARLRSAPLVRPASAPAHPTE